MDGVDVGRATGSTIRNRDSAVAIFENYPVQTNGWSTLSNCRVGRQLEAKLNSVATFPRAVPTVAWRPLHRYFRQCRAPTEVTVAAYLNAS